MKGNWLPPVLSVHSFLENKLTKEIEKASDKWFVAHEDTNSLVSMVEGQLASYCSLGTLFTKNTQFKTEIEELRTKIMA